MSGITLPHVGWYNIFFCSIHAQCIPILLGAFLYIIKTDDTILTKRALAYRNDYIKNINFLFKEEVAETLKCSNTRELPLSIDTQTLNAEDIIKMSVQEPADFSQQANKGRPSVKDLIAKYEKRNISNNTGGKRQKTTKNKKKSRKGGNKKSEQNKKKKKKKRTRRKKQIKSRRRQTIGGEIVETFRKVCCRCELNLTQNALGGIYDGVICVKHRSCTSCWFNTYSESNENEIVGQRNSETVETKYLPLVGYDKKPPLFEVCPGCSKNIPPYNDPNYVEDLT